MYRDGKAKRKLNKNHGSAMIVALVVSAVIMVFCLSLIMVTYTLFVQTSNRTGQMQCREMAQSYALSLKEELADENSTLVKYLNERLKSTDEKLRWQAVDADAETDPDYSANAQSEIVFLMRDADGYTIKNRFTYKAEDYADVQSVSGNNLPAGATELPIQFTVTCYKGAADELNTDMYSLQLSTELPYFE